MADLLETLHADLKAALKGGDRLKVSTIRFVISQTQYARIEKGSDLDDRDVLAVLTKQAKSRRESIEAFQKGGREDLAGKERAELALIQSYLPAQMEEGEVRGILAGIAEQEGYSGPSDMGRFMKAAMPRLAGKADGALVSRIVKEILGSE